MINLPIANGFYQSESLPLSNQECTNWYPNIPQTQAMSAETLFGTPGLLQVESTGNFQQINRGAHNFKGRGYFVNGETLYRLNRSEVAGVVSYSVDALGDIEGSGRVSIADNGFQMMVLVPGGKGYIFTDDPDALVEITSPGFRANGDPQLVVFIDSYFACNTDQKRFIVSANNDGTSWNALDFGSAEQDPDDIVALIVYKNQLFAGGTQTMEAFQNIGGAGFPFQRNGLFLEKGISAPFAVSTASDSFLWIGAGQREEPAVWQYTGGDTPVKVSTTAIDNQIQSLSDSELAQTFAWSYAERGAYFVGFTSPQWTFVYDLITQRWHQRKSKNDDDQGRFRPNSFIQVYGNIYCGDSRDGRLGMLDSDTYTEYGDLITRVVSTQPFINNMMALFVTHLELTVESGVGDSNTPDPKIRLETSNDGKSWNLSQTRAMGPIGDFQRQVIWRRLGRFPRMALFRFTLTDPVKPVIISLMGRIKGGV